MDDVAPRLLKTRPRVKKLPTFLTKARVRKLIYAAANLRDRALVELYYATGCRNSELRIVRIETIDFRRRRFKVGAKRKERMVYFGAPAARAIKRYIGTRRKGYLFQDIIPAQRGVLTHTRESWVGMWRDFRPGKEYGKRHTKYLGSWRTISKHVARRKFNRFLKGVDLARPKPDRPLTKCTNGENYFRLCAACGAWSDGAKGFTAQFRHSYGGRRNGLDGSPRVAGPFLFIVHANLCTRQQQGRIE